jgi:hypothetical protein
MKEKEQVRQQAGVKCKGLIGMIVFFLFASIPMTMAQEAAADAGEAAAAAPNAFADVVGAVVKDLPGIGGALVLLLVGLIIAKIVALIVTKLLEGNKVGSSVSSWLGSTGLGGSSPAKSVSSTIFYLIMLVVVLGVVGQLQGDSFTPWNALKKLGGVVGDWWQPVICAAILVVVAWALATLARLIVSKVLGAVVPKIDGAGDAADQAGMVSESAPQSSTAGDALYYGVLLLFLPLILTTLRVSTSIAWVDTLLAACTEHGPNILTAAVILWVGCLVAQVARRLVTEVGSSSGLDTLAGKLGIAKVLNDQKLSGLLGLLVYIGILIPVLTSALGALQLSETASAVTGLAALEGKIPAIISALIILVVTLAIAKVVSRLTTDVLSAVGFDTVVTKLGLQSEGAVGGSKLSAVAGTVTFGAVVLYGSVMALNALGVTATANLFSDFLGLGGQVLVAGIIIAIGLYLANIATTVIRGSGASSAGGLASLTKIVIVLCAVIMGLNEIDAVSGLLENKHASTLALGALAVAAAIAFGIGGRDLASRKLQSWTGS